MSKKWSQSIDPVEDVEVSVPPKMTKLEFAMIIIGAQLRTTNMTLSAIPAAALDLSKMILTKAAEAHEREAEKQ